MFTPASGEQELKKRHHDLILAQGGISQIDPYKDKVDSIRWEPISPESRLKWTETSWLPSFTSRTNFAKFADENGFTRLRNKLNEQNRAHPIRNQNELTSLQGFKSKKVVLTRFAIKSGSRDFGPLRAERRAYPNSDQNRFTRLRGSPVDQGLLRTELRRILS